MDHHTIPFFCPVMVNGSDKQDACSLLGSATQPVTVLPVQCTGANYQLIVTKSELTCASDLMGDYAFTFVFGFLAVDLCPKRGGWMFAVHPVQDFPPSPCNYTTPLCRFATVSYIDFCPGSILGHSSTHGHRDLLEPVIAVMG